MRLRHFRAATVAQAMAQVRTELGDDALILSTRRVSGGVEVSAAIEPADPAPARLGDHAIGDDGLAYHGVPPALASRLAGPDLEGALASFLRFEALPGRSAPVPVTGRLLLAGLPGAGKTLTIAKLATEAVLAGNMPAVITTDGRRAGAAEELAAYTRLLGLELMAASSPAALGRALAAPACRTANLVLIDTSGVNPFAADDLGGLTELMAAAEAWPVLVMAAGQDGADMAEHARCFADIGFRHLLVTRLDLARRLGGVVAAAHAGQLALTLACASPGATNAPAVLTPPGLAALLRRPEADVARAPRPVPAIPIFPKAHTAPSWRADRYA